MTTQMLLVDEPVAPIKRWRRTLKIPLAVTLAYLLTGKLALLLALPPGYASAIFPSAGIRLHLRSSVDGFVLTALRIEDFIEHAPTYQRSVNHGSSDGCCQPRCDIRRHKRCKPNC